MLCHEMARQIVKDPIVRAGIRITLELSADDRAPPAPISDWITGCEMLRPARPSREISRRTSTRRALARFVIGAFTGVQTVSQVLTQRTDLEQRVDEMWGFLLPGIMPATRHQDIARIRRPAGHPTTPTSARMRSPR